MITDSKRTHPKVLKDILQGQYYRPMDFRVDCVESKIHTKSPVDGGITGMQSMTALNTGKRCSPANESQRKSGDAELLVSRSKLPIHSTDSTTVDNTHSLRSTLSLD